MFKFIFHIINKEIGLLTVITLCAFLLPLGIISAQNNILSENSLQNTYIFYLNTSKKVPTHEITGKDFFKPYLSYKKENGSYSDKMMDSFLFMDLTNLTNGKYVESEWYNYLDQIYTKTRLPIFEVESATNNIYATIGDRYGAISNKIRITNKDLHTIKFDVKVFSGETSQGDLTNDLLLGVEFFDNNGKKYTPNSQSGMVYSEGLDMHFKYINIDEKNRDWQTVSNNFVWDTNAAFIKIHFVNWNLKDFQLGIDNVIIKSFTHHYLSEVESTFQTNPYNTNWEYYRNIRLGYMFSNRSALIDDLNDAVNELFLDDQRISIVLSIPEINPNEYKTTALKIQLKNGLSDYINKIYTMHENWKSNNSNPKIDIAGLYYVDENIVQAEVAFYNEIFAFVRDKVKTYNWQLTASPYNGFYSCSIDHSYHDDIVKQFDVVWMQPNAFYVHRYGSMDRDMLERAHYVMSKKKVAVNIENRIFAEGEEYGRVNDYFDYGERYGYINYAKLYYDDAGAHYVHCHSNDYKLRVDYDNLYKFIKKGRMGVVVNRNFEMLSKDKPDKFYYWDGQYQIKDKVFSFSETHIIDINIPAGRKINSYRYAIAGNENYAIAFRLSESNSQSKDAFVGVRFYDNNNNLLSNAVNTGLTYSAEHNGYVNSFQPSVSIENCVLNFSTPVNAVSFEFFLTNMGNSDLGWSSLRLIRNDEKTNTQKIFLQNDKLQIDHTIETGNYSLMLNKDNYAISQERIPISADKQYEIKIMAKEADYNVKSDVYNKALIGIELYDIKGQKIMSQPSIEGLNYSTALNMHYFYLGYIQQDWANYSRSIHFPDAVKSIKLYIRNWYYERTLLLDNLSLSIIGDATYTNLNRKLNKINLLEPNSWGQVFPLIISYKKPVVYADLIDVENYNELKFSALIKGTDRSYTSEDLLSVEFYDADYNLLNPVELLGVNLNYSSNYMYWYPPRFEMTSINCEDYIKEDEDRVTPPNWYNNQWVKYEQNITLSDGVKFIRIAFHKLTEHGEYRIVNPQMIGNLKGDVVHISENKRDSNSNFYQINNDIIGVKNPLNCKSVWIYDISGRLLYETNKIQNLINVTNFCSGIYVLISRLNNKEYVRYKFVKY